MSNYNSTADNRDNVNKFPTETVLLLVAGGSLGAYECGVFKSLAKHNIWFDTIAGTSIGAVNSTIIIDSLRKSNLQNKKKNREGNNSNNNDRSEERRVGKECRYRWTTYH